jgi:hypothetical protein
MEVKAQPHRNGDGGTGMLSDVHGQRDSGKGKEVS